LAMVILARACAVDEAATMTHGRVESEAHDENALRWRDDGLGGLTATLLDSAFAVTLLDSAFAVAAEATSAYQRLRNKTPNETALGRREDGLQG